MVHIKCSNPQFLFAFIFRVLENGNKYITDAQFKQLIICGLKDLYGEVGASFPFDLLKFDQNELTGILRVYNSGLVKLWSALTLLGSYQNEACAFRVTQVSPFLLALSGNSRELRFGDQLICIDGSRIPHSRAQVALRG
uniref:Ribonuclease P protein subunit p14-like n=1 Tax=Sinocyclocheilus anshuiensis TaxID=1608454 RepID=A0A671LDN8_9TELE